MNSTSWKTRQIVGIQGLLRHLGWVVITGVILVITAPAEASIMLPESPVFTLEDLDQDTEPGTACGTSSIPTEEPAEFPYELPELLMPTDAIPTGGTSGGTSSTSSSTGGWIALALSAVDRVLLPNTDLSSWISGESRFALPMPPGNDLLRPPREI